VAKGLQGAQVAYEADCAPAPREKADSGQARLKASPDLHASMPSAGNSSERKKGQNAHYLNRVLMLI
jgi:hypothetical protein